MRRIIARAFGLARLDERGAVAAEFAVTLPAVILVLLLGVGVSATAASSVRLQHGATEAARLLGRGDETRAVVAVAEAGGTMSTNRGDGVVCVSASATTPLPVPLPFPPIAVRACALDGGR